MSRNRKERKIGYLPVPGALAGKMRKWEAWKERYDEQSDRYRRDQKRRFLEGNALMFLGTAMALGGGAALIFLLGRIKEWGWNDPFEWLGLLAATATVAYGGRLFLLGFETYNLLEAYAYRIGCLFYFVGILVGGAAFLIIGVGTMDPKVGIISGGVLILFIAALAIYCSKQLHDE